MPDRGDRPDLRGDDHGQPRAIGRFATKAQFATYTATAPPEAFSGSRTRHQLNPRGNRTLKLAIHIAAGLLLLLIGRHERVGGGAPVEPLLG